MENQPFLLLLVACPLGMVAMLAVTWVAATVTSGRAGQGASQAWSMSRNPAEGSQREPAQRTGDHRDEVAELATAQERS